MVKKSKNVVKLATNNKIKKEEKEVKEIVTIDEQAKERVDKLLEDVKLNPKVQDNLLELDNEQPKSVEWLQEQVTILTEKNETLNIDYKKILNQYSDLKKINTTGGNVELIPDSLIKNGVSNLFMEVQNQYLGLNERKSKYTDMKLIHLLNKLLKTFPFLEKIRRF